MSRQPEDYEVGYKRPPKATRWKKGQSGNPSRRHPMQTFSALEAIDRLLLQPIEVVEKGKSRRVTTLEAIVLQLWQQELSGNQRALVVRLKYERIAQEDTERGVEIEFAESDYSRALAAGRTPEGTKDE